MMSLTIRPAVLADLDAIWAIESAVFSGDAWSRGMIEEELTGEHRQYLVLIDAEGGIRGYGGLLVVGETGDIQTVALAPEVRGGGYGRRLMDALLDAAALQAVSEVFLEVRADNPVAQSLYLGIGFAQIAVREKYYQPEGVDAIVMRLQMKERR